MFLFKKLKQKQKLIEKRQETNSDELLYIILPYFNYCKYENRKRLFLDFLERIRGVDNIRPVIVEATYHKDEFQLPENIPGTFMHLGFHTKDRIWLKENLINLAIKKLPEDWKYVAWVDADVTFLNEKWVEDTVQALKGSYDVVQMFQSCVFMGPNGDAMKIERSFGYMHCESEQTYTRTYKYGFWHPGMTWACTRAAYEQMGGLVDFGILGSGDHHMALAFIGKVELSHPGNVSKDYATNLHEFQERCKGMRLGYVKGTILHHWHGRLEDRKYRERWDILTKNVYMPRLDVLKNGQGLIQLTARGSRLSPEITQYFADRKEDNTVV